jgi:poly(ADP-ribose) glycohydrolase
MIFSKLYYGGGVLDHRADQLEINFLIYPELMAGMVFFQPLFGNESIIVRGCDRYSHYSGRNNELLYKGDYRSEFRRYELR